MFSNLLNNAAKYTEAGGEVALTAVLREADVVVTVRDTGVGISPEILPRVFDLFTQADRTTNRSQGGLGIGLSSAAGKAAGARAVSALRTLAVRRAVTVEVCGAAAATAAIWAVCTSIRDELATRPRVMPRETKRSAGTGAGAAVLPRALFSSATPLPSEVGGPSGLTCARSSRSR